MTYARLRLQRRPVECINLTPGDRIKFQSERQRYTVRAVSSDGRWVICTKPFNLRHTVLYTIIDFDSGVRGPDNLVFSFGYESEKDIVDGMGWLESGDMGVSVRYDVYLDIESVDRSHGGAPSSP